MSVLVTGGVGFLGSHVCEYYKKKGYKVVAYDNLTKYELSRSPYKVVKARNYNLEFLKDIGVDVIIGDILDYRLLEETIRNNSVEYIVNCCAQPAMTISIENPVLDFRVNVEGAINLLELATKYDIPLLLCSTIHVYGNGINKRILDICGRFTIPEVHLDENEPVLTGKLTPLHASKRSMEIYGRTYHETYGTKVGIFRLTGIYGPRQMGTEDHGWVANFTIRILTHRPIKIFGTDKQVRDILYVTDAVEAIDAFRRTPKSGIYNVGGGVTNIMSLRDVIDTVSDLTGIKPVVEYLPPRKGDLWYFVCNIDKIRRELKWIPKVSPREGLTNLVGWVEDNLDIFR